MRHILLTSTLALGLLTGCVGGVGVVGTRFVVEGAGPDDMLKLRAGPGLNFNVILGLPDGTALNRRACVTELGQRWCEVSLVEAPGITGYVAEDYLSAR